ncbi:4Fe-4S binding protein [Candidatus Woesearchaeota archaeon]|jgi:pyruvate ferredoxin oxidoreductase delta subunit|nr:4Fe-4S binding protein [Candidatus Woesearchaeota archaeon]MBT3537361.1 4Fe-4S binding protein [Candidatus Woesearchaeota archaeon]MBT4697370.1 4Fe-4S binding protein [Candidatus Woesearchaeota archaeon]MBT4717683.1 4Fe-4S binding protein [Candidatus Woesearchaeota archaeon]MBT7106329.1 4Fe-4S binding protein [Candidatus Woesearchaeota archaeon]
MGDEVKPVRDVKKCTKCGFCWMYCPDGCIDKRFDIEHEKCKSCGICVEECPFKALELKTTK